jgi:hypothetical protein
MRDEDPMQLLCRRLLAVLDENIELRHLVMDMAMGLPLNDDQRALLEAVDDGRWSR